MLKKRKYVVTTVDARHMNVIPAGGPDAFSMDNVIGKDMTNEPKPDPEGLSGVPHHRLGSKTGKASVLPKE